MAEVAVASYFADIGFHVLDVSSKQLEPASVDWKDFDLLVGSHKVDVKNARPSISNPNTYVEHCLPRSKAIRSTHRRVKIFGTICAHSVSTRTGRSSHDTEKVKLLGKISFFEIERIAAWFNSRFGTFLDTRGLWRENFQPGWLYEYPLNHYPKRHDAIISLNEKVENCVLQGLSGRQIPSWLISLCSDRKILDLAEIPAGRRELWVEIDNIRNSIGLSRPTIYCFIVGYFLESIILRREMEVVRKNIEESIFPDGKDRKKPLGLDDPNDYIYNIFRMLSEIYLAIIGANVMLSAFRMPHPLILKGKQEKSEWLTLSAYCGGMRRFPWREKCGTFPLQFGLHENCERCRKLICPDCGHCCDQCALCEPRQERLARKQGLGLI